MISIITAVYNQLPINRIYVDFLRRYTSDRFELIIIDNGSTDGSREFFQEAGATVIANDGNYSYGHCQNQGMDRARGDLWAFLNNDIIVAPSWDATARQIMGSRSLDILSPCGVEKLESKARSRLYRKKWSAVKHAVGLFSESESSYRWMHRLMYGNWERFCARRSAQFGDAVLEGFVGCSVLMTPRTPQIVGRWDDRIQAADFDLFIRAKKRSLEQGDIKPMHVALGLFHHHYIGITRRGSFPQFKNKTISLADKWGQATITQLLGGVAD
jgi:GT2 family glycosyltransferase